MAKRRKTSPPVETAEQIAARLKGADTERNEARGRELALIAESAAEKSRWRDTLALCPASTHELAMVLLKCTDFPPDEIAKACSKSPGASGGVSSEQPSDNQALFMTGAQSAARLLGLPPEAANALSPFADKVEPKPFDYDLYKKGAEAAKLIMEMTGASK
jgi:hypothetical protein